jgi:hypothetical protein
MLEMHFIGAGPRAACVETFHERHHAFEFWKALIRFFASKVTALLRFFRR